MSEKKIQVKLEKIKSPFEILSLQKAEKRERHKQFMIDHFDCIDPNQILATQNGYYF